jgi:hypothetical protein
VLVERVSWLSLEGLIIANQLPQNSWRVQVTPVEIKLVDCL